MADPIVLFTAGDRGGVLVGVDLTATDKARAGIISLFLNSGTRLPLTAVQVPAAAAGWSGEPAFLSLTSIPPGATIEAESPDGWTITVYCVQ